MEILHERCLTIFKPDVIQRQIVGELLTRFERKGIKIVAMKMLQPTKALVEQHYTADEAYLMEVGVKGIENAKQKGEDVSNMKPLEVGRNVRQWNIDYLTCGPVLAVVFEGPTVVEAVRKLIGYSNPQNADIGTIRSDYTPDSFLLANMQGRTTRTLLHASDSPETSKREIDLWFGANEIFQYETAIEKILFDKGWSTAE